MDSGTVVILFVGGVFAVITLWLMVVVFSIFLDVLRRTGGPSRDEFQVGDESGEEFYVPTRNGGVRID
jgi:hypothetical protein